MQQDLRCGGWCSSTVIMARRHVGSGFGGWLVHAGGAVVVLRAVSGFFWWR
jgi:hypothetical protein